MVSFAVLFIVLTIVIVTLLYAYKYQTLSKMSMRNAFRRKISMLLIIAGSLTGTAFIVGSFVINDSFQYFLFSNIRKTVGEIDEVVQPKSGYFTNDELNSLLSVLDSSKYVDGTLPVFTRETVAAKRGMIHSLNPKAITTVIFMGVDVNRLKKFGDGKYFPNVKLSGNDVVIGSALAKYLNLHVGDTIQALTNPFQLFFGLPPTFKIVAIVPQKGVLGYQGENGFTLPIFMSISSMRKVFGGGYNRLFISNTGDYLRGVKYTDKVDKIVKGVLGDKVKIHNIKEIQIKSAQSQQVGKLFFLLSSFAVAAGTILMMNIYTMLSDERKSSLGTLRAIGFSRKKVGFILYFEGFVYSVFASMAGTLVGLLVAWFMINEFSGFFSTVTNELSNMFSIQSSKFVLHFNFSSLLMGFSVGILIPLSVLAFTSVKIGRLNIVKAIRNIPQESGVNAKRWSRLSLVSFMMFLAMILLGNQAADAFILYFGIMGSTLIFPHIFENKRVKKYVGNISALFLVAFAFFSNTIPYVESASLNSLWFLGVKSFSILAAALVLLSYDIEIFDKLFSKMSTKSLKAPLKLAMAEISQNKRRTGMTIAMYAIVIFVISLMTIIPYSQVVEVKNGRQTIFQGYDAVGLPLVGNNVNVTSEQLKNMKYVSYYATASMFSVRYAVNKIAEKQIYQMVDVTKKMLLGSAFEIRNAVPQIKDLKSLWEYLKAHPGTVAVYGLSRLHVGDTVDVAVEKNYTFNFSSGVSQGMEFLLSTPLKHFKTFKVVAMFKNTPLTAFPMGFYTTSETIEEAFGNVKSSHFILVKLRGKTEKEKEANFEKFLAFLKSRFSIGLFSKQLLDVFANMILSFVNIINSFLYFGLLIGIVGLAILILKTLHERKRTIGILKALGFTYSKVFASFFIETNFVVILGIFTGFVAGWITSFMIYSSLNMGQMFMPWLQLLGLAGIFYAISVLATVLPIRKAAKLPPAEVLRYYE